MTCTWCNGSGEKDQATLSGYMTLDCDAPNCTAATERAALEAANKAAEPMTVYDQRWFAYQAGVKAGIESAAKVADGNYYGPCGEYDYSYNEASSKADDRAESISTEIRALLK